MGRGLVLLAVLLAGCGARSSLRGSEGIPASPTVCRPGDPPIALVSEPTETRVTALATDGTWLYVVQVGAPTLYDVPTGGGPVTALDTSPVGLPVTWQGGVYVNTSDGAESVHGALWISYDGLARRAVYPGFFVPPSEMGGVVADLYDPRLIVQSIEDGHLEMSLDLHSWTPVLVGANDVYFHVVAWDATAQRWSVERFERASGALHDIVGLGLTDPREPTLSTSGPNAFCVYNECVLDDAAQTTVIDLDPTAVLALDEDFAYGASNGQLVRVGLRDSRRDVVANVDPQAVTTANGCIYVASSNEVLRASPPN